MIELDIKAGLLQSEDWAARLWVWVYRKLLRRKSVKFSFPNLTMERGESLIVHSPLRADVAAAIKIERDGTLVVLLDPPSVDSKRIEICLDGEQKVTTVGRDIANEITTADVQA